METKTLYVGNIPYDVIEGDLLIAFGPYGGHNARIIPDRGFAFVDVAADRLQDAIDEKHDSELRGRRLTVNEAKPRQ